MTETETKETWELAPLHIQAGDIITSKKGILVLPGSGDMKKAYRAFRLEYLGNGGRAEGKEVWEPAPVHIKPGDTITSKKGLMYFSNLTGKKEFYRAYKMKYLGNCGWEVTGCKEPVEDVTEREPGTP